MPWMYLQMISIIDQTAAISFHIACDPENSARAMWYIPVSSIYLGKHTSNLFEFVQSRCGARMPRLFYFLFLSTPVMSIIYY